MVFFRFFRRNSSGEVKKEFDDGFSGKLKEEAPIEWMRILLNADWNKRGTIFPKALSYAVPWGKMLRRQFLIENNIMYPEQLKTTQEDICFNTAICQYHPRLYVEKIYAYIYRYVPTSTMHRYNPEVSNRAMFAYQYIANIIKQNAETKMEFEKFLYLRAIRNFLVCCGMDFFHPQNPKTRMERKRDFLTLRNHDVYREAFKRGDLRLLRLSVRIGAVLCKYKLFSLYEFSWRLANRLGVSHA